MSRRPLLGYQPALDGLRAIAVVGVLLYHSGLPWVRGGFLGVDVFFALSGFLITSLLLQEYDRWGHLDLLSFWGRRARRLLPALLLVIVAVSLYARSILSSESAASIRGDGIASIFYVVNWRFVLQGQSYFDQFTAPSPLRHAWSLAIEEQFYIVFPILLIGLLTLIGRRWKLLGLIFTVGAALSALLMALLYEPGTDPSRVYYGTDTRVQTLLVGAALAAVLPMLRGRAWLARVAPVLSVLAIVSLLAAFARLSDTDPRMYQGGFLLVAVISTVLVGSVVIGGGPVRWLLERKPLVWVGIISYGVYLWHWPIFVWLTPDRTHLTTWPLLALRLLVTFVVAAVSYEFVEQPIRSGSFQRLPGATRLRAGLAAVVATALVVIAGTTGAAAALAAPNAAPLLNAVTKSSGSDQVTAMLVGDSVPLGLVQSFDAVAAPGVSASGAVHFGCGLTAEDGAIDGAVVPIPKVCHEWATQWPDQVNEAHPEVVALFFGIHEQYDHEVNGQIITFGTPEYAAYLTATLDGIRSKIASSRARVVLVNAPCRGILDLGTSRDAAISNDPVRIAWLNDFASTYVANPDHATGLLDFHQFICPNGYTNEMRGKQLRSDGLHFTADGASIVWSWLGPELRTTVGATPRPVESGSSGPSPVPTSLLRVFILGDSNAYSVRSNYSAEAAPGFDVSGSTQFNCGLFPQTLVAEGVSLPPDSHCQGWFDRRKSEIAAADPDLGVLFAGSWEQYDRQVGDKVLVAGTPEWTADLAARYAGQLQLLGGSSRHVVLVLDHCHRTADLGTGPEPHIVNDDARVADVNVAAKQAAKQAGIPVTVIDLNEFLCKNGYTNTMNGVTLRVDGLHFTPEGAKIVWAWLGPQFRNAARD